MPINLVEVANSYVYLVRDSWENTKEEREKKLSDLLGQPWTINVDPKAIYPYAEEGSWGATSLGDLIVGFVLPHSDLP